MAEPRTCRDCGALLSESADSRKLYCNDACRKRFQRKFRAEMAEKRAARLAAEPDLPEDGSNYDPDLGGDKLRTELITIPDYIKKARELATSEVLDDEIREVLREEIRRSISTHVQDKVLGISEVMVQMLPEVMSALYVDLKSKDYVKRSAAYKLIMQYSMGFLKQGGDGTPQNVTIINPVPTVATEFGQKYADEVEAIYDELPDGVPADAPYDPEHPEPWEADWPICTVCKTRKHPDDMRQESHGVGREIRDICTACQAYKNMERYHERGHVQPERGPSPLPGD